ncbi:hypothetical protein FPOA_11807 [Fusarium poae]|jgi:hypothetical protein|uniref:Uncharacterized protein n=1 Tax=Fusarium poae TaxID=36050 RepID=A0A1B8AI85_FUSPO|nr:hypothetical protein FPOA_11807 [Fusarium poae]
METQFLPFDYGNKRKLEEKLAEILGAGNFQVIERMSNQWKVLVSQRLNSTQIEDIRLSMRRHYLPTV